MAPLAGPDAGMGVGVSPSRCDGGPPEDRAPEDLREPDEPGLPEPESSGTKKRKDSEYIKRYEYLPQ